MDDAEEGQKGEDMEGMVHVSASSLDLRELLPSIKVWSDWMLGHPDQWNPPPHSLEWVFFTDAGKRMGKAQMHICGSFCDLK